MVNSVLWVESMPSLRNIRPSSNTRSTPPTSSRLRYSSLATLRYRSVSRALWWVTNGRARAPPGTGLRIGDSTSVKPRASMDSRRDPTTRERSRMVSRAEGLTARSSSRWRERTSTSARPFHLSGRGRRALPSRYTSVALTDSSPLRVLMTGPWTPTQSPMSRSPTTSNWSGPSAPVASMTWSSAPSWRRVQKARRPMARRSTIRPATRTTSPDSWPPSRAWPQPWRTSARVWVRRKPTGKASIPAALSRASLARRTCSTAERSSSSGTGRSAPRADASVGSACYPRGRPAPASAPVVPAAVVLRAGGQVLLGHHGAGASGHQEVDRPQGQATEQQVDGGAVDLAGAVDGQQEHRGHEVAVAHRVAPQHQHADVDQEEHRGQQEHGGVGQTRQVVDGQDQQDRQAGGEGDPEPGRPARRDPAERGRQHALVGHAVQQPRGHQHVDQHGVGHRDHGDDREHGAGVPVGQAPVHHLEQRAAGLGEHVQGHGHGRGEADQQVEMLAATMPVSRAGGKVRIGSRTSSAMLTESSKPNKGVEGGGRAGADAGQGP